MGNALHYGSVRYRVVGSGTLISSLYGYDNVWLNDLANLTLATVNSAEQVRLANFISQRAKLRVSVNAINDYFKFNSIVIFVKPIYTSFPNN